jgi:hypothetical protein
MKSKARKLTLNRETLATLEARSLRAIAGGGSYEGSCNWVCTTFHGCSDQCDSNYECSTGCDLPTNLWQACG